MKRIKFDPIEDITSHATTNPLTLLLKGSSKSLDKVRKKLTVRNTSIPFQIDQLMGSVQWMLQQQAMFVEESPDFAILQKRIDKANADIKDLREKEITLLYADTDNGIEVPAGLWWFAATNDNSHTNNQLKQFYAPGLRDYQIQGLEQLYKYKRAGLCLATGLGKSLIIASLCKAAENSDMRACVVVPTEELVGQMIETISALTTSVAGMGGGRKLKFGTNVMVTTAQSALKVIDNFNVIIIDEAHHSPAATWADILSHTDASHVYMLTATPFRSDGQDMAIHAFTGPIVFERNARWGIANGWLKPVKVYMKKVKALKPNGDELRYKMNAKSASAYKGLSTNYAVLDEIKKMLVNASSAGRKCIVIFKTVKAGEALKKHCKDVLKFDVASSAWKKPLNDFRDGKTMVLVSNDRLISEGINIPDANFLIMCTQNSSRVITSQALGRVLRKTEGFALVIDVTFEGYVKFERSRISRENIYREVTDDVFMIGEKSAESTT